MLVLHTPTLFIALSVAFLVLGLTLAVARRSLRDSPEVGLWELGTWLTLAAFAMFAFRAIGPEWISILGGNALLFAAFHLYAEALHRFVRGRPAPAWQLVLTLAGVGSAVLMIGQPMAQRAVVVTLFYALELAAMTGLVLNKGWHAEPSLRTVGISLAITLLAFLLRVLHAGLTPSEYQSAFQVSVGNGLIYLVAYLFPLGVGVGFLLANLERASGRLRALASNDGLTGCLNRATFEIMLANAWDRAHREKRGLSFLLLDLDQFKLINDEHGHQVGDSVLQEFVRAARSRLRASDVLGRVGGEEFAVILPYTDAAGAMHIAEQLRTAAEGLGVRGRDGAEIKVTISVGISTAFGSTGERIPHAVLYGQADRALYASKSGGRNRAMHFEALFGATA